MWIYFTLVSSIFLGCYDVVKKKALAKNDVMWVLFTISLISTALLAPFFKGGPARDLAVLAPKAVLVTVSWISGLAGMKLLPLTTASTLKASRPVFVILFSILIFGERLTALQWVGVALALASLWLLSRSSRRDGIYFSHSKGILWMGVSIVGGVLSALYDKHIMRSLDPMFVECWSNLFITALMGIALLASRKGWFGQGRKFSWDWMLPLAAVLIVAADCLYFFALAEEGSLLAIVSLVRRGSVIVTFLLSAWVFREKNVKYKAFDLALLLCGIILLCFSSVIH